MIKRKITLLLENPTDVEKTRISEWCSVNKIVFNYITEDERGRLYYFSIDGCTKDYESLQSLLNNRLRETNLATLGNLMDCNDEKLEEFKNVLSLNQNAIGEDNKSFSAFCKFITPIKDIKVLEHIEKYQLTDLCRDFLKNHILGVKGLPDSYDKYLKNIMHENKVTPQDFNAMQTDPNGNWIRVEELNEMIRRGIFSIDRTNMEKYHADTRLIK